ncbi:MAG: hypothetical protein WEC59_12915 [Salibacteraceae bacterium]
MTLTKNSKLTKTSLIIFSLLVLITCTTEKEAEPSNKAEATSTTEIWVHRVNSIMKWNEVSRSYNGIETDVVFENGRFDVNHPPAESIDLSLNELLSSQENIDDFGVWLDFKNLTDDNAHDAMKRLNFIVDSLHIKRNRIIIEAKNTKALSVFQESGFNASYYVPTGMYAMDDDKLEETVTLIRNQIAAFPSLWISSNYKDYPFLKQHFPNRNKLFWETGGRQSYSAEESDSIVNQIKMDTTVMVLLVQVATAVER